jgi:hypothetical protein
MADWHHAPIHRFGEANTFFITGATYLKHRVWYQYWDKTLTIESSWLARLKYTYENAVHHRLVRDAKDYPWCSASWFEKSAPREFVQTVARMKTDKLKVYDPFDPAVALPPHS